MNPVYLDLHIHTSDNPSGLNENYDLDTLIERIKKKAQGDNFLISFTDHNVINKKVYLEAVSKIKDNIILGAELVIQTHIDEDTKAYHCHIYFNLDDGEITSEIIDDINSKLEELYPEKTPERRNKKIPVIQQIIEKFDEYDFILLPHGGQTHSTFDQAIPKGREFDNAMQRSIYYNFFDGFTSRSEKKTDETKKYLKRLGVQEFVNLITCTDNYNPEIYPKPKDNETYKFVPTWMFATPTFGGLRISLSDNSRLIYSHKKPRKWRESIKKLKLKNDKIDIDISLTPGLNVVIGESSSGKTLLVDSLYRKITGSGFEDSEYNKYGVEDIDVKYPDKLYPHFIKQNFIANVIGEDKKIDEIEIISKILPENSNASKSIGKGLKDLNEHLDSLFEAVEKIEILESEIKRIPALSELIISEEINENILKNFLSTISLVENTSYSESDRIDDIEYLDKISRKLINNPFVEYNEEVIEDIKEKINEMRRYSILENNVREIVEKRKDEIDGELEEKEGESQRKKRDFDLLINKMKEYYQCLIKFEEVLEKIAKYSIKSESEKVKIKNYVLSVENKFKLNKEILKEVLNSLLLNKKEIENFDNIAPENLFKCNFRDNQEGIQRGSGATYELIKSNIYKKFNDSNKVSYKIKIPDGKYFDKLSPGLKTSIILELLLNFEEDRAPLIIDQPEDNLATSYMNDGIVKSIKEMKSKKQIIFVSHNATIPMAGDAQNIILCENYGNKIKIRSNPLEGNINNTDMVDYIAEIADGGKPSIKKRFKKYNLKKFKE